MLHEASLEVVHEDILLRELVDSEGEIKHESIDRTNIPHGSAGIRRTTNSLYRPN